MKKHIPNILTTIRMLLVPLFVWFIFGTEIQGNIFCATIVFIIASVTDYFDGMLARKFNVISDYGKIMDPLADKLLVISALIAMAWGMGFISKTVVIVILIREVLISFFREFFARKAILIPANIWGKVKTMVQMTGIGLIFTYESLRSFISDIPAFSDGMIILIEVYFWLVALLTWYSGIEYYKTLVSMRGKK